MLILGIESSALVASLALLRDDTVIMEYTSNDKKTHSQTLMPMLEQMVAISQIELGEIDAIAISHGPGSFTGLRIGAATAKGLGMALNKPVIGVPTLEAMAMNIIGSASIISPMMDAKRNQVYNGLYKRVNGIMTVLRDQRAMDVSELIEELNTLGESVIFLGDGTTPYKEMLEAGLSVPYLFAPPNLNRQRASNVALLGATYLQNGNRRELELEYLRKSQAERERSERMAHGDAGNDVGMINAE